MKQRIFIAGIWHETNTFSSVPTDRAAFEAYHYVTGAAIVPAFAGTNTEIGGMLAEADVQGLQPVLGLFAGALPSAPTGRTMFGSLMENLCTRAGAATPLDGAAIALHGAMVAEGFDEADAEILERLTAVLGPDVPVVATFDLHANLSPRLVAAADALVGYRTNPHVDMADRGAEAVRLLARRLNGEPRLAVGFRKVPFVSVSQTQVTADPPMAEIMDRLNGVLATPGIASASVAVGYPYADVAHLGLATLAYGSDAATADAAASGLAEAAWTRRAEFVPIVVQVADAVARAVARPPGNGPVIMVDVADNIGGGTPGDGTAILDALLTAQAPSAAVVLADPEAARAAAALGVGATFHGAVGGRTDTLHGSPVDIEGTVTFAGPVEYRRDETWMEGQMARLGTIAVVAVGGVRVVLTETRVLPYDTRHLRTVGIEPEEQGILVVKAAAGWRTPFEAMMSECIYVDGPGVHAPNLGRFPYVRRSRPLYPLDGDFPWSAACGAAETGAQISGRPEHQKML